MTTPESSPDPEAVDPTTRLVLARLASGASRLAGTPPRLSTSARTRVSRLGTKLFPSAPGQGTPSRLEAGALAVALVAATLVGAAMPGSRDARATPAAAVPVAATPPATAAQGAVGSETAAGGTTPTSATTDDAEPVSETPDPDPLATPAAVAPDDTSADSTAGDDTPDDDVAGDEGDGSDPLAGGTERLDQVALVIVRGDAPARWPSAPEGSPAKARADLGTTLTGLATLPGAPLATSLGLVAGQAPNPATREGCTTGVAALTPGTVDDLGRAAGTGCDYPAGTASLPTAIAVDGRRWRAYVPVPEADAASALCGTGTPSGLAAVYAATSPLRRLSDLITSGGCESAAAPLAALAEDLAADEPPAWVVVEVGACPSAPCDADGAAARDRELDGALKALRDGLAKRSAILVVGDGAAAGLEAGPADSLPAAPDDPTAPAPVLSGALLLGTGVAEKATDPLPLSPYAIARTQADWLGVDAPGWARADGVTGLAVPSG